MDIENELNKSINVNAYRDYVRSHFDDYDIYFVTYTFKNTFLNSKKLNAEYTLKLFKQKLMQASVNKNCRTNDDVILLCIREESHESKVSTMQKEDHYHCFLMIHKRNEERFYKRAVERVELVEYETLNTVAQKIHLFPKIYKIEPSNSSNESDVSVYATLNPKAPLENHTIDVRRLLSAKDVERAYDYACKNIRKMKINFTHSQLRQHQLQSAFKTQLIPNEDPQDFLLL